MNKLNIKEYKTKAGEVRYILRGAYIGTDVLTGKQIKTDIRGRTKTGVKNELERLKNEFKKNGNTKGKESLETFGEVAESFFSTFFATIFFLLTDATNSFHYYLLFLAQEKICTVTA
ncbi:putative integrase [Lactococcus phage Q33]|uniref:Putative integrase n=1 Tax=Lactococcus phage Q33 TaxID=254253 RepID=R9QN69_9CAUD|nr:putative integrase [Lactococcus phage Q33]AFV51041.1 putative integrase [Lactococcus phage Q33]